jgi:hypothetical protein
VNLEWTDDESVLEAQEIEAGLSTVLRGGLDGASPEQIEQWIDAAASQLSPVESFDLGNALRQIGQSVGGQSGLRQLAGQALPLVGTAVGTAYGGPVGAAIGSQLGQIAGQAVAGAQPKQQAQAITSPGTQAASGAPIEPTATVNKAAGQLLHVTQNPAFLTSLLSLVMGSQGRTSVPVAGKDVPVAAFMNLVSTLAGQAAQGAPMTSQPTEEESIPSYLTDAEGRPLVDPVDPVQRADVLMKLLQEDAERQWIAHQSSVEAGEEDQSDRWEEGPCEADAFDHW